MAVIVKESSTLQEQAKSEWTKLGIMWVIAILSIGVPFVINGNPFMLLVPIFIIAFVGQLSWKSLIIIRGNLGEKRVFNVLRELPNEYHILNDITIKIDGKEAQIDHLVISPYGVWSVETKSHLGWIYGKEKDRNWTQKKKSDKGKIYSKAFYNPITQNAVHCNRLSDLYFKNAGHRITVKSLVVFTSADKLDIESTTPVVTLGNMKETIRKFDDNIYISQEHIKGLLALLVDQAKPK